MGAPDLTRWNRAGVSRFRYVDGNAATHLEALRIELAGRFEQWRAVKHEGSRAETPAERTARVLEQYHAERRDWAWETTRAFARALHILTEHIDAFANEGYLRTATQWQSVRRLAAMIGYAPAPASSATTPLVLIAKSEVKSAAVKRGFAVKHVPAGAPPVIFETLEDVEIAPGLNELRLAHWNRNAQPLSADQVFPSRPSPGDAPLWPIPKGVEVSVGGLAILEKAGARGTAGRAGVAVPAIIASVTDGTALALSAFTTPATVPSGLTFELALLHVSPLQILLPRLNGPDVVRVLSPHDLAAGGVVAWTSGTSIRFARVLEAKPGELRLQPATGGAALPTPDTPLFRAAPISFAQFTANESKWRLPIGVPRSGDFRVTFAGADAVQAEWRGGPGCRRADERRGEPKGYVELGAPVLGGRAAVWFADPGGTSRPRPFVRISPRERRRSNSTERRRRLRRVTMSSCRPHANMRPIGSPGSRRTLAPTGSSSRPHSPDRSRRVHGVFAATLRPTGHDVDPTPLASSGSRWNSITVSNGRRCCAAADNSCSRARAAHLPHSTLRSLPRTRSG